MTVAAQAAPDTSNDFPAPIIFTDSAASKVAELVAEGQS